MERQLRHISSYSSIWDSGEDVGWDSPQVLWSELEYLDICLHTAVRYGWLYADECSLRAWQVRRDCNTLSCACVDCGETHHIAGWWWVVFVEHCAGWSCCNFYIDTVGFRCVFRLSGLGRECWTDDGHTVHFWCSSFTMLCRGKSPQVVCARRTWSTSRRVFMARRYLCIVHRIMFRGIIYIFSRHYCGSLLLFGARRCKSEHSVIFYVLLWLLGTCVHDACTMGFIPLSFTCAMRYGCICEYHSQVRECLCISICHRYDVWFSYVEYAYCILSANISRWGGVSEISVCRYLSSISTCLSDIYVHWSIGSFASFTVARRALC